MSKSINWLSLPDALWCKIFEYDETYHQVYKNLLSEETQIFCGHGPTTSIGYEKKNNPFLKEQLI